MIRRIANHFGYETQRKKAIEELGELKVELKRKQADREKTLDEICDVLIMLLQLIYLYGFSWLEIIKHCIKKLRRTIYRMKIGYYDR
jgi:NTP pyrophosphatase (non-canonical NTP hydrolase)